MSATFPHLSTLSSSYNSFNGQCARNSAIAHLSTDFARVKILPATQNNLETLIAQARADPNLPSHRELAQRRRSSAVSRHEALTHRQDLRRDSMADEMDETTVLLDDEDETEEGREAGKRRVSNDQPTSRYELRRPSLASTKRASRLSAISDRDTSTTTTTTPVESPSIGSARRSRSRSISRARMAAGALPGFSAADLSMAAETN